METGDSTTAEVYEEPAGRVARWLTRLGRLFLVAIPVVAAFGLLGPREGTASAAADGWQLDLTYPQVTRAGQPVPLTIVVRHAGGITGPVTLSLCGGYFDELDFQNWYPNPSAETRGAAAIQYQFDPPAGDVLTITLDARAAPGQFGSLSDCAVAVLSDGVPAVQSTFTTWRMP